MRILVPLDGSARSLAAVPFAGRLARAMHADIVLIVVGDLPESSNDALTIRTELHERIQHARAMLDDVTVHALVEISDRPANVIVQAAGTQAIDLIVMSTHGRSGLARMLQGSVAEAVLRQSPVPVTMVRPTLDEQQALDERPAERGEEGTATAQG